MISTQHYQLNMVPDGSPVRVYVSQYDVGRNLNFTLYNESQKFDASGLTAVIAGTKRDDKGFSYAGTVDGSTVTVATTAQMTAVAGPTPCEIRLSNSSSEIVGTANFILDVEPSALNEDTAVSDSDIASFEQLNAQSLSNAGKASESATQAQSYANQAQTAYNNLQIATTSTNSRTRVPSAQLEYQDRQNIALKANLNSPNFTGSPTTPTPADDANNTDIANTLWTKARIGELEQEVSDVLTSHLKVYQYNIASSKLTANSVSNTLTQKIVGGAVWLTCFEAKFNAGLSGWQTIATLKHGLPDQDVGGVCDINFNSRPFHILPNGNVNVYCGTGSNTVKSGNVLHLNASWIYGYSDVYNVTADGTETLVSSTTSNS